jgi:predicted MFS family arabinose efflux permease
MAPNLSAIADDFGFSDEERDQKLGGDIALGFFILGAPAAAVIGYLADTTNRSILLGLVVIFGESACLGTYFVKTYEQLFFTRVLTGISIGGATPVIFSLMADFYGEDSRIYVSTIVGVAISIGQVGGQLMAGLVGPSQGWRMPFLIVAVPAIALGILLSLTGTEPKRGSQERVIRQLSRSMSSVPDLLSSLIRNRQLLHHPSYDPIDGFEDEEMQGRGDLRAHCSVSSEKISTRSHGDDVSIDYSERIDWKKLGIIVTTPSAVIIFLQGLPGCVPWGMIYTFLNDYFSEDRGMSVEKATVGLSIFGVGGLVGMIAGGWLGQRLYSRNKRSQPILMGSSTLIAIIPMLYLINGDLNSDAIFYTMAAVAGFFANINGPNVRSVLQVSASSDSCAV